MCVVFCVCVCVCSHIRRIINIIHPFSVVLSSFSLLYIFFPTPLYILICVCSFNHILVFVFCVCVYNVSFFCSFSPSFRLFSVINVLLWLRYYFKARLSLFSLCVYFLPFPFFLLLPLPFLSRSPFPPSPLSRL